MDVRLPVELGTVYKSPRQRARVITEAWGEANLYCPNCTSLTLARSAPNTEAVDFDCPECGSPFQLKSQARPLTRRIPDAAYAAMRRAILEGRTPNLVALHYDPLEWQVRTLLVIPHFVFSLSAIRVRKPLAPTARRSGWVGCDISLENIAPDAKILVIANGIPINPNSVRKQYDRLRPLEGLKIETRGWTLDVLNVVRSLGKKEFALAEVYAYGGKLRQLHPRNRYVDQKIRQQLQRLRDLGFLEFVSRGRYRVK